MLHRFLGVVYVRANFGRMIIDVSMIDASSIDVSIITSVMVQNVTGVLCHVLDHQLRAMLVAAAHMRKVTRHGGKRLSWKHQHQKNQ